MKHSLSHKEQAAMERVITQIAQRHGVTEAEVRRDITEAIVEGIKNSQDDPVAQALWKACPCKGNIPTPEEFIFWTSSRVLENLEGSSL